MAGYLIWVSETPNCSAAKYCPPPPPFLRKALRTFGFQMPMTAWASLTGCNFAREHKQKRSVRPRGAVAAVQQGPQASQHTSPVEARTLSIRSGMFSTVHSCRHMRWPYLVRNT